MPELRLTFTDAEFALLKQYAQEERRTPAKQAEYIVAIVMQDWAEQNATQTIGNEQPIIASTSQARDFFDRSGLDSATFLPKGRIEVRERVAEAPPAPMTLEEQEAFERPPAGRPFVIA